MNPPRRAEALVRALVVENPATSSPGLAFLLATVAHFGPTEWLPYWQRLKANGVLVVNGWSEAYDTWFAGGEGKGNRSLVVSYASSPPAAVLYGPDPKATVAPTGVTVDGTSVRRFLSQLPPDGAGSQLYTHRRGAAAWMVACPLPLTPSHDADTFA